MKSFFLPFIFLIFISASAIAQVNLSSGLVAYYPFNGTFNDASGNGNHGTGMNGVTFGTDQWGNPNNAAQFDGINDWINVGVPSFTFGRAFSIAFRFRTNSAIHQCLMSKSNYSPTPSNLQFQIAFNHPIHTPKGLYLATNHTGTCNYGPSGDASHFGITPEVVTTNQWGCVVMTFNNGVKSIYVNGFLRSQTVATGAFPATTDSCVNSALRIGTWWQSDPRYFGGSLDEIRMYRRVLNTQEIDSFCKLVVAPPDTTINKYAAISGKGNCDNSFLVDTATGFAAGDTVLMIQMKGADIDSSNTSSFGSILNYNGAGNYEFNVVSAVVGNSITLRYKLSRSYNIPGGRVQLVRVPYFTNYTLNQKHTAMPWNGRKGGILVLNASGTVTMNAPIDVSAKGFRNGNLVYVDNSAAPCGKLDYYYSRTTNSWGAEKGEGIAELSANRSNGRGPQGSGGGGGNSSNGGGAGGSNGGAGGTGGNETVICSPVAANGGIGGKPLSYSNTLNKVFMGGGSGAGHANNANGGTGTPGGGIVLLLANQLVGNGFQILSDGGDGIGCVGDCWDAQPGGSAGGSVLLHVNSYSSNLTVYARGGKGASHGANNSASGMNGPGGGGGGGAFWVKGSSLPSSLALSLLGGQGGVFLNTNNPWGATSGQAGTSLTGLSIPFPTDTFKNFSMSINFRDSVTGCVSRAMIPDVSGSNGIASYHWVVGGTTSSLKNPVFTFPGKGAFPVKLVVTDSNGCKDSLTKLVSIDYPRFADAGRDTSVCIGKSVVLSASGGVQYAWSPAATLATPAAAVTIAAPLSTTSYVVTVTDAGGCIDRDTVVVTIGPSPTPITAYPSDTAICKGKELQLMAVNGTSYQWSPAKGLSNPAIADPVASVSGTTRYIVSGIDVSGCQSSDTVTIRQAGDPQVRAESDGLAISCDHKGAMLFGTGAVRYSWTPVDYLDDPASATPIASPPRTMTFQVTGYDSIGCKNTDTITVYAYANTGMFMPDAFSPNGDGRNDRIRPIAWCDFDLAEYRVYNRWGEEVFYGFTQDHAWNGTFAGHPADVGVYFYMVRGKTPSNGKTVLYKGSFTLVR